MQRHLQKRTSIEKCVASITHLKQKDNIIN